MSKSKFLVSILGRNGTRVFYGALGLVLMGVSIAGMFGYVNLAIDF